MRARILVVVGLLPLLVAAGGRTFHNEAMKVRGFEPPLGWESQPVGSYARQLRLTWAAARLTSSDDGIAQIALQAGFFDQSHFTRAFGRHFGLTPLAYRNAAQQ